jgi:hypothetical protein
LFIIVIVARLYEASTTTRTIKSSYSELDGFDRHEHDV